MDNKDRNHDIKIFLVAVLPSILVIFVIFFLVMPQVRENREANNPPGSNNTVLNINGDSAVDEDLITNFEECLDAGYPALESYPRQCNTSGGQHFVEQIDNEDNQPMVGGDRDEHGCIGSAGYSWCEVKEKCLRVWEEACE